MTMPDLNMGGGQMPPGSVPQGEIDELDLNLSTDAVPLSEYTPADEGIYDLFLADLETVRTNAGEIMIVLGWKIENHPKFSNKNVRDNITIPGDGEKTPGPNRKLEVAKDGRNKYEVMMGMLRDKLEAITGKEWRDDNIKLNPRRDLSGATVSAQVKVEAWENKETGKSGYNNTIGRYLKVRTGGSRGPQIPGVPTQGSMPTGVPQMGQPSQSPPSQFGL